MCMHGRAWYLFSHEHDVIEMVLKMKVCNLLMWYHSQVWVHSYALLLWVTQRYVPSPILSTH